MKLLEIAQSPQHAEIKDWLAKYGITNYTIRDGGIVDVDGDVNLINKELKTIPVQFGQVSGYFFCRGNNLTSLQGAPQYVGGDFYCSYNKLTSLEYAPSHVGGSFDCIHNKLTSLQGAPSHVGGYFDCSRNNLTSLQGAPSHVGGSFDCIHNKLTSLQGAPSHVGGGFYCGGNNLTSLTRIYKQIKQINGEFRCDLVPNMLGILMIKGIKEVHVVGDIEVQHIFNKHLNGDIHTCQEELIDAGFADQAKL